VLTPHFWATELALQVIMLALQVIMGHRALLEPGFATAGDHGIIQAGPSWVNTAEPARLSLTAFL
jgi:hypothetical protein